MNIQENSASIIRPGQTIIGRREFHLKVESVKRDRSGRVVFVGLNGWGEEMRMIYQPRDVIQVITTH